MGENITLYFRNKMLQLPRPGPWRTLLLWKSRRSRLEIACWSLPRPAPPARWSVLSQLCSSTLFLKWCRFMLNTNPFSWVSSGARVLRSSWAAAGWVVGGGGPLWAPVVGSLPQAASPCPVSQCGCYRRAVPSQTQNPTCGDQLRLQTASQAWESEIVEEALRLSGIREHHHLSHLQLKKWQNPPCWWLPLLVAREW